MNQKKLALLLAAAITLTLGGSYALATQDAPPADGAPPAQAGLPLLAAAPPVEDPAPQEPEVPASAAPVAEAPAPEPDPEGTLSFPNLAGQLRSGNLNYLILEGSIASIEITDYADLQEELKDQLNLIANMQWSMATMGSQLPPTGIPALDGALQGVAGLSGSMASQSMGQAYTSLKDTFDDLKEGKLQADNADLARQLRSAQNQVVMGGETVYITLQELQDSQITLERSLAALDRQIQELELRYQMGQVSALSLQQARAGRSSLVSTQQSLAMG